MESMDAKVFWADSRGKVIAVLVVLLGAALIAQFRIALVWQVFLALLLTIGFDSTMLLMRSKRWSVSLSSIITGLLIGLVFDPLSGLGPTATACFLASISKNFIGAGPHKHIFNPAAFGIVVSSLIFNRPVAWWGAAWGMVPLIILAAGMLPILWRLHRHWMPATFLIIYMLSQLTHGTIESAVRLTLDGTVFLFAFVMLPEIKTSPTQGRWRWGWGVLVGVLVLVQNFLGIAIADPLLLALLAANPVGYFLARR